MKQLIVFLVIISFLGCSSHKPKKPDNLISKDKMVAILYDVFVLNAAKGSHKTILENNGIYPENYVFKKYDIDSLQFALSNDYYVYHVEDYESIISRVEARIKKDKETYQRRIDIEGEKQLQKKDSIKNARAAELETTKLNELKRDKKPEKLKK